MSNLEEENVRLKAAIYLLANNAVRASFILSGAELERELEEKTIKTCIKNLMDDLGPPDNYSDFNYSYEVKMFNEAVSG